jgi:hypothetical protein
MLVCLLAYYSNLKMAAVCSSLTSVGLQRTTRRYIPEDDTLHNHRCENHKLYKRNYKVRHYAVVCRLTSLSVCSHTPPSPLYTNSISSDKDVLHLALLAFLALFTVWYCKIKNTAFRYFFLTDTTDNVPLTWGRGHIQLPKHCHLV